MFEIVKFLRNNMATKSEIAGLRGEMAGLKNNMATKSEIAELRGEMHTRFQNVEGQISEMDKKNETFRSEIYDHIDGFVTLHQKVEIEIIALRAKVARMEERMERAHI